MRMWSGVVLMCAMATVALADEDPYKVLRSPSADATSYLQTNWNRFTENYHPTYVLDEDPNTAWVEGVEGLGEGQVLTLPLSRVDSARSVRVRVRNGYQKSAGLLASNAAPNAVRIQLIDSQGTVTGTLDASLTKTMGWQDVIVPLEGRGFSELTIEVLSAHAGTRYNDTCISDVRVEVDSDQEYSSQAEAGRKQQALTWIGERVEAARYFQNLPADYPFELAGYDTESADANGDQIAQRLDGHARKLQALKAADGWYDVSMVRRIEPVDGLWPFMDVMQWFVPANNAWFEADGPRDTVEEDRLDGEDWVMSSTTTSRDKVRFAPGGTTIPVEVYRRVQSMENGRGVYREDAEYLARFNDAGRMVSLYRAVSASGDADTWSHDQLFTFTYDGEGKLTQWAEVRRQQPVVVFGQQEPGPPTYEAVTGRIRS